MGTRVKRYVIFSYLVFWFMVLGICGTASMVFNCPPVIMRVLSNICAWAPTIVLLTGFKFFCPEQTVGEFFIKKEDPEEMHLKKDDDNFEMHIRQELPKEVIEWFKTL